MKKLNLIIKSVSIIDETTTKNVVGGLHEGTSCANACSKVDACTTQAPADR